MGGCFSLARVDHAEDRSKEACIFELNACFKETCQLLREVTGNLHFVNDDAILNLKDDISSNPDLLLFIQEFFKNSADTLKFFAAIKQCCYRAHEAESIINSAIQFFDQKEFSKSLVKLRDLRALGNPFMLRFLDELRSVCLHQRSTLFSLNCKKHEIKQKVRCMKAWRKVWIVVGVVTFTAVLISSVVLAVMMVSPIVTATIAAFLALMEPIRRLCNPLWKKWKGVLEGESEVVETVKNKTCVAISDLDEIRVAMEKLEVILGSMAWESEFVARLKEELPAREVMEEMRKKVEGFGRRMVELEREVDECSWKVKEAFATILQAITSETCC